MLFFSRGKKKKKKTRKAVFSLLHQPSSLPIMKLLLRAVRSQTFLCAVCHAKFPIVVFFFLKQTWWHCCNNKAYSPAKHLAKRSLHAPHHWAALDEKLDSTRAPGHEEASSLCRSIPGAEQGNSSCNNAAGSCNGRQARQKAKAAWSCSVSAEPFNKVLKVSAGKLRQAKLLTGTYCPPWQQVGLHSENVSKQPTAPAASAKGVYSQIARQLLLLCSRFRSSYFGVKRNIRFTKILQRDECQS